MNHKKFIKLSSVLMCAILFFGCGKDENYQTPTGNVAVNANPYTTKVDGNTVTNIISADVIKAAHELTTLKYDYEQVAEYEGKGKQVAVPVVGDVSIPFTEDAVIFVYGGTICIGFSLDEVEPEIDEENKKITVPVPEVKILSHTENHDIFRAYTVKNSVMTTASDKINEFESMKSGLMAEKEDNLINDKVIREEAIEEYKTMCTAWLNEAGATGYEIVFK